jgi:hypothetical protein
LVAWITTGWSAFTGKTPWWNIFNLPREAEPKPRRQRRSCSYLRHETGCDGGFRFRIAASFLKHFPAVPESEAVIASQ